MTELKNIFDYLKLYSKMELPVIAVHPIIDGKCACGGTSCSPGKHPSALDWPNRGTSNYRMLEIRWQRDPNQNVGVVTGNGFFVLDVDNQEGFDYIDEMSVKDPTTKDTFTIQTGSGGYHYYYALPEGIEFKNSVKKIPGCDIRSSGGFVVVPPSLHLSGNRYEIINDAPIGKCPEWLINDLQRDNKSNAIVKNILNDESGYIQKTLRNDTIFRLGTFWMKNNPWGENSLLGVLNAFNNGGTIEPLPQAEILSIRKSILGHTINIRDNLGDDRILYDFCFEEVEDKKGKVSKKLSPKNCAEALNIMFPIISEKRGKSIAYWIYKDGVYGIDEEVFLFQKLRLLFGDVYSSADESNTLRHLSALTLPTQKVEFNPNPFMVATKNKVIDFSTGKTFDFSPDHLLTSRLPIIYDPLAKCPKLLEFIYDIAGDPTTAQLLIDIFVDAALTIALKQFFIIGGGGDNGKSEYINLIKKFFGDNNCVSSSLTRINDRFGTYSLYNKLVLLLPEEPAKVQETSTLKAIVGRDQILGEQKGKDPFDFVPHCTPIITTNDPPIFIEAGEAMKTRITMVDLPNCYKLNPVEGQKQAVENIIESITSDEELSGLLNLVIKSAPRVIKNMRTIKTELHDYDSYYSRSASMDRFLNTFCSFVDGFSGPTPEDFYQKYEEYCAICGVTPKSKDAVSKFLAKQNGYEQFRTESRRNLNVYISNKKFEEFKKTVGTKPEYTPKKLRELEILEEIINLWLPSYIPATKQQEI